MATTKRTYEEPKPADPAAPLAPLLQRVFDFASRGLSKKTIAVRLGITVEEFYILLDYVAPDTKNKKYTLAYDAGRANFEEDNLAHIEAALDSNIVTPNAKAKIARENLKTLEDWAPATRTVKVSIENAPTEFKFESFAPDDLDKITKASITNPGNAEIIDEETDPKS